MSTPRFDDVWPAVPGNGWLTEAEGRLLWDSVVAAPPGPVLEVGCYKGRSTCLLAALGRPLYCVDPFSDFDDADPGGERILAEWADNLTSRFPGCRHVTLFRQKVEDWTPRPVAAAYLDGDHTYEGTLAQLRAAKAAGATVVCVHDYSNSGGGQLVARAVDELCRVVTMVETMARVEFR